MKLRVVFTHAQSGWTLNRYAFWDGTLNGHDILRVRTAFPRPGIWTYSLTCESGDCQAGTGLSDAEVQNRALEVAVTAGTNQLQSYGYPWVRTFIEMSYPPQILSRSPILFSNGEPFPWLGDSAWAAPLRSTPSEWKQYVLDREMNRFTLIHVGIAPSWAGGCIESDTEAGRHPPFSDQPSGADCAEATGENDLQSPPPGGSQIELAGPPMPPLPRTIVQFPTSDSLPDPAFWKRFEEMIQYANCRGLVVMVAGVIEPVSRYPELADLQPFARNLAARLSGNAVILSPGFDSRTGDGGVPVVCQGPNLQAGGLIRAIGTTIAATAPHLLVTNHFAPMAGNPLYGNSTAYTLDRLCDFHPGTTDQWMSFWMPQTGYNNNDLSLITERPRTLVQGLRGITDSRFTHPTLSVVNGEAVYDQGNPATGLNPLHTNRYRARQAGWLSWLSGATGYTFGAMGIWEWGICGLNLPPGGLPSSHFCNLSEFASPSSDYDVFSRAMAQPSSRDMTRLMDLLGMTAFSELVVNEQTRIGNQPAEEDKKMAVARDYNHIIAYLPHNDSIRLKVENPYSTTGTMFPPRGEGLLDGQERTGTPVENQPNIFDFANPYSLPGTSYGDRDVVLILPRSASSSLGWSDGTSETRLEVRTGTGTAGQTMTLLGHITGSRGESLSSESSIAVDTANLPFAARAARAGSGRFVVAWQERSLATRSSRVWIRRIAPAGQPLGDQLDPTDSTNQARGISVAASKDGRFAAIWEEQDPEDAKFKLRLRAFKADGSPTSESISFVPPSGSELDSTPLLGCDPYGACIAIWQRGTDSSPAGIWIASFSLDSPAEIVARELRVAPQEALHAEHVIAQDTGEFQVAWERFSFANESLGVMATTVSANGHEIGDEVELRGPWQDPQ